MLTTARPEPGAGSSVCISFVGGRDPTIWVIPRWPPRLAISKKLESGVERGLRPKHSDVGCGCFKCSAKARPSGEFSASAKSTNSGLDVLHVGHGSENVEALLEEDYVSCIAYKYRNQPTEIINMTQ